MKEKWNELAANGLFEIEKAEKCLELSKIPYDKFLSTNFDTAINSTVSIVTIKKYLGEEAQYSLLEESISIINELVPEKNKISKPMIMTLIKRLCLNYYYLTVSEVIYALSEGLCGQYGSVSWGAIGIGDLISWIDAYDNIRRANLNEKQIRQHSEHNKSVFNSRYGGNENPFSKFASQAKALREQIESQEIEKSAGKGLGKRTKEKLGTNE